MVTIVLKGTSPSQGTPSHILSEETMVPKLMTLGSIIFGSPQRSLSSSERKKEKTLPYVLPFSKKRTKANWPNTITNMKSPQSTLKHEMFYK